jgi:UDP-N-acetylglucosamine acyltransferase
MIHPTAIIHPAARIGQGTRIGPYAVIDADVSVGEECEVGPHVYLTGRTRIGAQNRIHAGCVIGDLPQDVRFTGEPTSLIIGDSNIIREHVTIHRSNNPAEPTRLGSNNLLMAHSHLGHNAQLGSHIIIANGALLAGHVLVDDRVFISGNCLVHQFVRIGTLALMQGGSAISKDLPPYTIARGDNTIAGLNTIGLRRAGFTSSERLELRRAYHLLFRSPLKFTDTLARARTEFHSEKTRVLLDFLSFARRGFCADRGQGTEAAEADEDSAS